MAIVGLLELGWRDISAGAVEPLGVVPVNPRRGCELELPERSPAFSAADEFGLVEAVDRLGESVVIRRQLQMVGPRGSKTQIRSRGASVILVDQAAEQILSANV